MPPINPPSKAFAEYLENWESISDFLEVAPPDSEQLLSGKKRKLAIVIYRSCILLLSSYLERYVESLMVEAIDAINYANLFAHQIPERLRIAQVKESLNDLSLTLQKRLQKDMTRDNVTAMLQKSQIVSNDYGWFLDDAQQFNKLSGEPLIGENRFSNPAPDRIDELFHQLGIDRLTGKVIGLEQGEDRRAIRDKVSEMVEKRNNIAHTGGTITVTEQDVRDYLQYSNRLVRGIDNLVGEEVQRIINGHWPWT
ncbi:MAG: MAE_28990/MAE_18760 family HEPN-like nuclease [Chloroflexota bacterium]